VERAPKVPVFNGTHLWNNVGIADDGKYVIVEPSDGRVFAINNLGFYKLKNNDAGGGRRATDT